jgi:hypothetical protein
MVRPNWLKQPRQVSLILEAGELEEFKKMLGNKSLSEAVREMMQAVIKEGKSK